MKMKIQYQSHYPAGNASARMRTLLCFMGLFCLFTAGKSWAYCTASNSTVSFTPNFIDVQRDISIGTTLGSVAVTTAINCNLEDQDGEWQIYLSSNNVDYGASVVSGVRNSAKEGIGIRWVNYSSGAGTSQTMSYGAFNNTSTGRGLGGNIATTYTFTDTFTLVKTGQITSGELPSFQLAYMSRNKNKDFGHLFTITFNAKQINQLACSVTNTAISVPMGMITKSEFTGIGSTSQNVAFAIPLNCDAGTRVKITFSGVQASPNGDGVLALSNAEADTTAKGVGVQLLFNNLPAKLNTPLTIGESSQQGPFTIPMTARYYQTLATVTAGKANATASFTMTYN